MDQHMNWHRVRVEGGYLRFTAAHFVTFGGQCERLHGHNYGVSVELEGELGEDQMVFDFTVLKHLTRDVCRSLNHYFLLPLHNPHLQIHEQNESWEIAFGQKRYILPREDVLPLPIKNSTAECLAAYIASLLLQSLAPYQTAHLRALTIGVSEAPTQTAYYHTSFAGEETRG